MSQNENSLLEEIRERRKYVIEIVAFAGLLALFVNLLSNDISECLKSLPHFWRYAFKFLPLIVSIGFLFRFIYRKTLEQTEFNIVLPLIVKTEEIKIEPVKGYSPPLRANDIISPLRNDQDLKKSFIKDWTDGNLENEGPFRRNIYDLVTALLISLIKLYCEHSLTTSSLYHIGYRPYAWKFKSYSKKIKDIQKSSSINPFLKMESIMLPQEVDLSIDNLIHINSPYCWMKFNILPYWMLITEENNRKTYKIIMRNINRKDANLLVIPLRVMIGIKRFKIFSKMLVDYYMWMNGLMKDAMRWLSWEEYEKGDLERLVVDINQDLQELKKELENKKEKHIESS